MKSELAIQAYRQHYPDLPTWHQDWRRVTLKGNAGSESFALQFFDARGRECLPALDAAQAVLVGTAEFSLMSALTDLEDEILGLIWDSVNPVRDWIILNSAGLANVATIRVSNVTGTITVGYGAVTDLDATPSLPQFSISPALQDQHLLADGQIWGVLPSGGTTQTILRAAANLAAGAGSAATLHFTVSRPNANVHLQYTAASAGSLAARVRARTGVVGSDIYGDPVNLTNTHDTTVQANNAITFSGLTPGVYELRLEATTAAANNLAVSLVQFD